MEKTTFTASEASKIRALLNEVRRSTHDAQKRLRQKIRDIGFYISKFRTTADGFTAADFDQLIARGEITIR